MAPLGPFEPRPALAVAVSGGADSMALVLLADAWARDRGGTTLALVADHGLRPESAAEAALTRTRLAARGIESVGLVLGGLEHGPGLAARARTARHAALAAAAAERGILHLLFGHHAGDQAETVAMRRLDASGPAGLAGIAALVETARLRLLRPLLAVPPSRLRATLRAAGVGWVEDPSNADPAHLRARLRAARGDAAGEGPATRAAVEAAAARGRDRAAREAAMAAELAARVSLHAEAYAILAPGPVAADALAAVLRTLAGAERPPSPRQVAALAAAPRPATLGGVRLLPAGRLGPGWLIVRETAAMRPAVAARPGAVWDGRFRLAPTAALPADCTLGPLGSDAAGLRRWPAARRLPAAVLATLPALRREQELVAVPHLLYPDVVSCLRVGLRFAPPMPVAGAPFVAAMPL
jgi:tRNA(Ile)-lysidine synthase